ncbi:3-oxoacyl-ACP reductase FabG [Chelatococcus asaccharovorans]|uniref:3-oxoacyl-ACP reductase FabG n=1 Tax=Chelatococcus asaccharovorans TaxID=28210 RepID=UPI00224C6844|nr:3-oxoacyl-ACP reductase FabG [Chelatococcus asaccharovorans]CAH1650899.1 3-oxoacyl-(acyl-carrier protein) reductase [Chelatococcus asaccharovorans]CAH1692616.1 3-oxoacyl-(acyl-carrier protein) reductase [Chelatococcus asaccharovorans]
MEHAHSVAVVSGGSSGIGLAAAKALLAEGWAVGLFSQQRTHVDSARETLAAQFGDDRLLAATLDLREPAAIADFFGEVSGRFGRIDALVSNAGFSPKRPGGRTPLGEIPLAEWNDVLSVNLTGALLCCQAVLPGMVERRHGRIILIGSIAGRTTPRIASASYVASKAALAGLARSIVSEYSEYGITANTICPGRILTEMTGQASSPTNQSALSRIPVRRLGQPEDIARAVVFLASPEAGFVNGAVLDINGGEFAPA